MRRARIGLVASLAAAAIAVTSCTYDRHFVPDPPKARYELRSWPRGSVTVVVRDGRSTQSGDSPRLLALVRTVITDALAKADGPTVASEELRVTVLDHETSLKGPYWNSRTRLQASLLREGTVLNEWTAVGEDKRWNMLPAYIDAEEGSQAAFDRAIASLMQSLARGPLTK